MPTCTHSLGNAFKALLEVRLNTSGVLRLGEDLQHLIVGQEKEAREEQSLLLQVGIEPLEDLVKKFIGAMELLKQSRLGSGNEHLRRIGNCASFDLLGMQAQFI